jgi:hypothetical protein
MMGPKTLSEIREELRKRIAPNGKDPVEWLEKQIVAEPDNSVLKSVLAVIKGPSKPKRKAKRKTKVRQKR